MITSWKDKAAEHLKSCYPKEGCGLVIEREGALEYVPCENIAKTPSEHFVMSPRSYADAEDLGQVRIIVHSHPDYPARPSEADRTMCEATGLEWAIFRVDGPQSQSAVTDFVTLKPEGFKAPLVGREFSHGINDCYTLVRDYYEQELGIELPDFERRDRWWDAGDDLYMTNFRDCGFEPVSGQLQKGDLILMQIRSKVVNHAGIYLGDGQMLHHLYNRLSTREIYGGYWAERTRAIIRKVK